MPGILVASSTRVTTRWRQEIAPVRGANDLRESATCRKRVAIQHLSDRRLRRYSRRHGNDGCILLVQDYPKEALCRAYGVAA